MGEVVQTPHCARIPIVLLTDVVVDLGILPFCHRLGKEAPAHVPLSHIFLSDLFQSAGRSGTCLNMKQAKDRKRKGSEAAEAVISILNH